MAKWGKLEREILEDVLIRRTGARNKKVAQGPGFGVDTSIVKLGGGQCLVVASDPTSLIPSLGIRESAWLSVVLTANDIATSGYLPQYAQFVFNLPGTMSREDLQQYWHEIHTFCAEMGIAITGGHTGFDEVGNTTISGGVTMFAVGHQDMVKSTAMVRPGLDIIMTKSAAFSSSAILARSFPHRATSELGAEIQRTLVRNFYQISILSEVKCLRQNPSIFQNVVGMHDVTEGGVLGAVYEMCEAGKVGVEIKEDEIPLGAEHKAICGLFEIDPYRSLGAGSLLLACKKSTTYELLRLLESENIAAKRIGETRDRNEGRILIRGHSRIPIEFEEEDPYWAAFFKAIEKKWS